MVNKTFEIPLDIKQPTSSYPFIVVEGDSGNILKITLTDDGAAVDLTGCKVLAVFSRPDGATVEQDTEGNGVSIGGTNSNEITINLYAGSVSPGTVSCEIQVYSGANQATLVTSAQFNFDCRRSIMNQDTILAEEKYPILVGLIEQVNEVIDGAQSDWTESDSVKTTFIKHKPVIPSTPRDVGAAAAVHASQHGVGGADPITPAAIGAEKQRLQFTNTSVATTAFAADTTYEDFPYRAAIALTGVLATMTPEVVFGVVDATSGNFAPVCACYAGGVYIYAAAVPDAAITIPTIICWKAVG